MFPRITTHQEEQSSAALHEQALSRERKRQKKLLKEEHDRKMKSMALTRGIPVVQKT